MPQNVRRIFIACIILLTSSVLHAHSTDTSHTASFYQFEENLGQFHENVLFRCPLPNGYMFLEKEGITYLLSHPDDMNVMMERRHNHKFIGPYSPQTVRYHSIRLKFKNISKTCDLKAIDPKGFHTNYFLGKDRSKWVTGAKTFEAVHYEDIYPGIDLQIHSDPNGWLKFDWLIKDGDANQIEFEYQGADSISIEKGKIHIQTSVGDIWESAPILIAQNGNNEIQPQTLASAQYILNGNTVSYSIEGNIEVPFVIDPALIFSTYSGSRGDNFGFTATYDSRGNLYAGGITNGDEGNYPVSTGAFQQTFGGGAGFFPANLPCDISISKYDSAGTKLLWASYLGGMLDEYPHSLVVDRDDDLLIFGTTYSEDYPTSTSGYDTTFNGDVDIVVTKISEDGTQLLGSTYIGGSGTDGLNSNNALRHNYADDFRGDIIPDEDKNIYVASCTESSDFPLVKPIHSTQQFQEGCILQLDPNLSQLLWSTFLGGSGRDALYSIKVDSDSSIYVGGGTTSSDLEATDSAVLKKYDGNVDGFIARLDRRNKKLTKLSYWGTPSYDQVYFIDLDFKGHVFLAGQTNGNIKPSPGVYGEENKGQFVAKLDTSLEKVIWQTSFGVNENAIDISPSAFLIDNCEHIYVSGWGSSVRPDLNPGSTNNLETTSNAVQTTTDGNDFYIIVLNKDAKGLLYATFFGGDETADHVDGGTSRFDKKGVIYQSVCSSCPNGSEPGHQDFPISANAAFTSNFSPRCSNASFKIDLQIRSAVDAYFVPDPILGCMPLQVNFDNRSDIAQKFIWSFGDGTIDTTNLNPSHTYAEPGEYIIELTVIDSNTCNISDVFTRRIRVLEKVSADFTYSFDACTNEVEFSTDSEGPDYFWDLGDGNTSTEKEFTYQYPPGGTYDIWLYINKGTLCEDSILKQLNTQDQSNRDFFIPNVFTPNNDGFNDEFCLDGFSPGCDKIELFIYNRWGELVYETDSIGDCWDGSVKNKSRLHPPGTYFYLLKAYDGVTKNSDDLSGTITLIREKF